MTKYEASNAATNLFDGGWRKDDHDAMMNEYGLTEEEADMICEELATIESNNEAATTKYEVVLETEDTRAYNGVYSWTSIDKMLSTDSHKEASKYFDQITSSISAGTGYILMSSEDGDNWDTIDERRNSAHETI